MNMIVQWINPDGIVTNLDDPGNYLRVLGPIKGVGMPDVKHDSGPIFDEAGEWWRSTRYQARDVSIGMALHASDGGGQAIRARLRTLARLMSPVRGLGTLRFIDGYVARDLRCRYSGGLSPDVMSEDWSDEDWFEVGVGWTAFDPWFYDTADSVAVFAVAGIGTPFFPMFTGPTDMGPHLNASSVYQSLEISNVGDGNIWPVWTIVGPGSNPILLNETTGLKLDLSNNGGLTLGAGDTLTLDTRPGARTLTLQEGTNVFPQMTDDSSIWPLGVGTSRLTVTMGGAVPQSNVTLTYRNRYLTL